MLGIATVLMLRPPAHVRFLAHARDNISENNLAAAEEDLDSALRLKPDFADALFELGRVSLARKDYSRAREWFLKLDKAETGPRGAAYLAYSFSVGGNPTLAIPWYERAISLGSQSAAVYNNLAFAYEIGRSRYDRNELLDRSAASLRRAMELAPGSHTVWLNLICLAVRQHELQETRISDEAIQLSRKLGKLHPTCGFVQLSVARALALAANDRPELSNEAVRSLELAANVGFAPSRDILESAPEWNALRANGDFARLVKTVTDKQQPRVGEQLSRLLNP
jgi:tetratricopeptide (TPR) repeat protein